MMAVYVGNAPAVKTAVPTEDFDWEKISVEELLSLATTNSLLGGERVIRFEGALAGARAEEFLTLSKELVRSPHQFIFFEEKLLKKPNDALSKAGAKIFTAAVAKKAEPFNMFALTGALAARDRKKLWLLLHKAQRAGAVPEAVAGMLHWKARDMLGKGECGAYTKEELKVLSRNIVSLYHDSHRGAGDLTLLLERFALLL